jgi:hypothetical protein
MRYCVLLHDKAARRKGERIGFVQVHLPAAAYVSAVLSSVGSCRFALPVFQITADAMYYWLTSSHSSCRCCSAAAAALYFLLDCFTHMQDWGEGNLMLSNMALRQC